jgi:ribosome maturation factor RimP
MINLIAVSRIEKYLLKNLNPVFFGTDYEIIRVKVYDKKEKIVQVMIDHPMRKIDINDCAKYSRIVSNFLDEKNLISDDYSLELSSPGIDRPLTRIKDFYNFKGNKIKVTMVNLENEKKVYKGILADIMEKDILLDQNKHMINIELDKISDAKLLV